ANVADLCSRSRDFRITGLQVSREVWKESAGNLHADPVPGEKDVAGQQAIKIEAIDFAGSEKFRLEFLSSRFRETVVVKTGAKKIKPRAHKIVCRAAGLHIEQPHPEIEVGDISRKVDFRTDRA